MSKIIRHIKLLFIFSGFFLFITSLNSCYTNLFENCSSDTFKGECVSSILFYIYNKDSTVNLLKIGVNRYHYDSVSLYDERWQEEPFYEITNDGGFYFSMERDEFPSNTHITKRYFLELNNDDTDTLDFTFIPDYKCEDYFELAIFEGSYNGVKQFNTTNTCNPRFKFYKDIY